jgi:hypothetical protein
MPMKKYSFDINFMKNEASVGPKNSLGMRRKKPSGERKSD